MKKDSLRPRGESLAEGNRGYGEEKEKKSPFKRGTYLERKMYTSPAYFALKGIAPQLLTLFLGKRNFNDKYECLNCNKITMTYVEIKALGISKTRFTRGRDDLMAKGFLNLVHQGGAYQKDKSIYALTPDWEWWKPGLVINERPKDTRIRGYRNPNKK